MSDSTTPPLWLQVPEPQNLVKLYGTAVDVPAFGGRLEVDWSPGERVTSVGGLVYFATFLKETGLFDRLCEDFPINYKSNNSSSKRDIVGTAVLAILLGKTRYVHIEAIRHDEAARELLGLGEIVSDAKIRRAFRRANEKKLDNCRAFGREDALVRRPAVRVSQVADAGTALGGGNFDPIAPRQRIDQVKTDFHTEAGREVVVIRRKPRQERAN